MTEIRMSEYAKKKMLGNKPYTEGRQGYTAEEIICSLLTEAGF